MEFHEKYNQKNSKNGSKIVGGDEVIPHSYPHQVAIFIDGFYFCGGSLIGDFFEIVIQNMNHFLWNFTTRLS